MNTARLIIEVFHNEHEKILRELSTFPKQQYIYLKAIIDSGHVKKQDVEQHSSSSPVPSSNRGIRITPEVCIAFAGITENGPLLLLYCRSRPRKLKIWPGVMK